MEQQDEKKQRISVEQLLGISYFYEKWRESTQLRWWHTKKMLKGEKLGSKKINKIEPIIRKLYVKLWYLRVNDRQT